MNTQLENKITELKAKHAAIKAELEQLANKQQQLIAELNGTVGAIIEFEKFNKELDQ